MRIVDYYLNKHPELPKKIDLRTIGTQLSESDNDRLIKLGEKILAGEIRNGESLINYLDSRQLIRSDLEEFIRIFIGMDYTYKYSKNDLIELITRGINIVPLQVKTAATAKKDAPQEKIETPQKEEETRVAASIKLSGTELQHLYESLKQENKIQLLAEGEIDVSANPIITDQLPIGLQDDFCLDAHSFYFYSGSVALLDSEGKQVQAAGHLEKNEADETHLLFDAADINYAYFRQQSQCWLLLFPEEEAAHLQQQPLPVEKVQKVFMYPLQVDFRELEETERTLCIDFGTSNTTAGSYGVIPGDEETNELEIVEFVDKSTGENITRKMVPTLVYVQDIPMDSQQPITYLFGYEALQKVRQEDYDTKASVFYEIKRWITDLEAVEDVCDEKGRRGKISHREIIKAYLLFVIHTAESQFFKKKFKTLHFTAPVKLKDSFINSLQTMFKGEYTILPTEVSLDEGIAIVYQHIAAKLDTYQGDKKLMPIMITDCGGGTTDLARCKYELTSGDTDGDIPKLVITNDFENGDANFGGNNLTFRILQMLKVKMAYYQHHKKNISVRELIPYDENEILEKIDAAKENKSLERGWQDIYKRLEDEYAQAEALIPTQFAEEKMQTKKQHVKRNFNYLWQLAEAYKKAFYQTKKDTVSLDFNKDEDLAIGTVDKDLYYLYWYDEKGNLVKKDDPLQGLELTITEIERLLYADIYYLWVRVLPLEELEEERYQFKYKLAGQSCKIDLFAQLLKEFVPGRYLREEGETAGENQLKLDCLEGSIRYIRDKEAGLFQPEIRQNRPKLLYNLLLSEQNAAKEMPLLQDGKVNVIFTPITAKWLQFVVRKAQAPYSEVNRFRFILQGGLKQPLDGVSIQKLAQKKTYGEYQQIVEDKVMNKLFINEQKRTNEYMIFALPAVDGYGVYLFQIRIIQENAQSERRFYLQQEPKYYSFESGKLMTFFNGKR